MQHKTAAATRQQALGRTPVALVAAHDAAAVASRTSPATTDGRLQMEAAPHQALTELWIEEGHIGA